MRGLRVLLLGQGRIELDGQPLTRLIAPKHQAIVFHLAATEAAATRVRLAALLWGGLDEGAARANLRLALTHLRRWLPGLLDIDDRQVGFAAGAPLHVDWRDVSAALREGAGDGSVWPERAEQAAAAWRGPFLDGFEIAGCEEYEHWLQPLRQRAQRDMVELRRRLLQRAHDDGRLDAAIAHAHALLEVDETDEPTHMTLMQLLAARGQRTAALAQYEACRAVLADRLGARPSAACYALYTRIHAEQQPVVSAAPVASTLAPAAPATPAAPSRAPTFSSAPTSRPAAGAAVIPATGPAALALHGREGELALLRSRLTDPQCRWLTLTGPGGVGKTRLAQAVASELAPSLPHGVLWFSGRDEGGALRDAETLTQHVLDHLNAGRTATSGPTAPQPATTGAGLLVVLDNLEAVVEPARLSALLALHVPGSVVLATSRVRVGGAREWLLELSGLALERCAPDRPASSPAATLLTAGVQRLMPEFDPTRHAEAVEDLCERVGGLPLALELAARAVPQQGVAALAARLSAGAPLADAGPDAGAGERQRSIERVFEDSWALLPDEATRTAALRLAWVPAEVDAGLADAIGVAPHEFATLRAHSWLRASGDARFSLHPLQQDHLRRRAAAVPYRAGVIAAMAAHLDAVLPAVAPFGDLPLRSAGTETADPGDARLDAAERLARSAAASAPVFAAAAAHLCAKAPLAQLVPWIDRAVALLAHARRPGEAAALLQRALARTDLPPWQRTGWALRRAGYLSADGASQAAMLACRQALADFGLGDVGVQHPDWATLPRALWRIVRRQGWPSAGGTEPRPSARGAEPRPSARGAEPRPSAAGTEPRPSAAGAEAQTSRAFHWLLLRSTVWQSVHLSFSPDPWPSARLGALNDALCRGLAGAGDFARISRGLGLQTMGHPRLARLASRRAMLSGSDAALDASARVQLETGRCALALALGQWGGLMTRIDDAAHTHALLHNGRAEMEQRSLAAKLAFYQGRLHEAARRFGTLSEASLRRPGEAWRTWGPIGQAEVGLCLGESVTVLQPLLARAARAMTELEMLDAAYTLRRLGLAAQLAWRAGDAPAAREAVLAGCAAAARLRHCGFWAHEGYAGLALVAAALHQAERAAGATASPLDAAWRDLQAAIARHERRFPPARALHLLVQAHTQMQSAPLGPGRTARARSLLGRAVRAAEAQGMRVDLARCCAALAALSPDEGWQSRARGLWQEMAAG